ETLAGSNDEAIFALAVDGSGNVIVATGASGRDDPRGRLYSVAPKNREISMIYQAKSRRITHLVDVGKGSIAAVASAGGRVIQVTGPTATKGEFFTVAYDAGINSSFGTVQLFGIVPEKTKATVAVRSGQTATPDATWSGWSPEISYPGGQRADAPNGRFVQLRLTLSSDGKDAPRINRMRIAYLRQNLRPFVREVVALRKGVALIGVPREEQKSKTVSLAEKASEEMRRGDQTEGRNNQASRARQVEQRGALTVRWVAEDPNGDELKYDLEFRPEGRAEWRTLNKDLDEPFYTVQSAQLPDGHYQFRVRATDEPSNPRGAELEDRRESTSVLIDNSQPRVSSVTVSVDGKKATAKVNVADNVGPIVGAEYAVDGGEFRPMAPTDGVLDGASEAFEVKIENLDKGPHTFTVRVIDEAENEGFGESSFLVK
ncbi:MAG TPA: fibronectin type III domain-containing protein, partial [Myxococcota bacterium]|nr:fibronectin type III domain-containing protein [Myxococcota bacterium]